MPPSSRGRHGRRTGSATETPSSSTPFDIWIKSFTNIERPLDGRLVEVHGVTGSDTVESVKDRLQNDLGVPRENQHLQFLGEDLQDWRTLAYYQIGAERITAEERAMEASTQAKADAERIIAEEESKQQQIDDEIAPEEPDEHTANTADKAGSPAEASLEQKEAQEAKQMAEAEIEAALEAQAAKHAKRLATSNAKIPLTLRVKTVDYAQALAVVTERGAALQYVSPSLQIDKQIALVAVQQNGYALEHAGGDPQLQGDKEVVLAAVKQSGLALEFAAESLRNDLDVVLAAVAQDGHSLQHAAKQLQADQQVVLAAVAQNGYALQYASDDLRADKDVVLAAVTERGAALAYASAPLRRDPSVNRVAAESGWK